MACNPITKGFTNMLTFKCHKVKTYNSCVMSHMSSTASVLSDQETWYLTWTPSVKSTILCSMQTMSVIPLSLTWQRMWEFDKDSHYSHDCVVWVFYSESLVQFVQLLPKRVIKYLWRQWQKHWWSATSYFMLFSLINIVTATEIQAIN